MQTLQEHHGRHGHYYGDHGHYLVATTTHRDAEAMTRANWLVFCRTVEPHMPDGMPLIERSSHWAVGWVDYLLIDPEDKECIAAVEKLHTRLESYPILDDDLYYELDAEDNPDYYGEDDGLESEDDE